MMSDVWLACFAILSAGLHALVVQLVDEVPITTERQDPDTLQWIAMEEPPPPPPPPEPEPPEPEVEPAPRAPRVRAPARRAEAPESPPPPSDASPPESAPPVDLTGVTLTAGTGGWAPAGNGQAAAGPIRAPRQGRRPALTPQAQGPRFVALAGLSRPPAPPNLDSILRDRYPAEDRRRGTPGNATVRARVLPTGRVDRIAVVEASSPSFARACREVLRGSRWSAPLDDTGRPVATEIRYRCRFQVR